MEDFWLIVVTEGNEDETEINELSVIKCRLNRSMQHKR